MHKVEVVMLDINNNHPSCYNETLQGNSTLFELWKKGIECLHVLTQIASPWHKFSFIENLK